MRRLTLAVTLLALGCILALSGGDVAAQATPPAAPTNLGAGQVPINSLLLAISWQDNAGNEESYRIERSSASDSGPWQVVASVSDACSLPLHPCVYIDRQVAPGTTYWYRVAAVNAAGASAYSNVASAQTGGLATPGPGVIAGSVSFEDVPYYDFNSNGVRDIDDVVFAPPRLGHVVLFRDKKMLGSMEVTQGNLAFAFGGLAPGTYTLAARFEERWDSCGGVEFSYNPLQRDRCQHVTFPWDTTLPQEATVTAEGGATVDLIVRPADVAVVTGDAILEVDHAARGTPIVAWVNGRECGTTTVAGGVDYDFAIHVLGARERVGCATTGDFVEFTIAGVPAANQVRWTPFGEPAGSPQILTTTT